ncbi:hypothetical protein PWY87_28740 [Kribbella solani]|uniref:hypothetical protein n=1 Tax=Kribbella solani TaxID=236067 RepID=UPI0029A85441|nr:hypothetical protein [Kribbella solani]MDX2972467.1 hypothetical protein [Kribbella solani]MDX3005701.1 hypothetical protein [Kribbella solani]
MPIHVFVDETKSRGFLMAAARCPAGDVAVNRKALKNLLLPRQERLHFRSESNRRRKQILQVIADFHLTVDLYSTDLTSHEARRLCLDAIVRDSAVSAERLVIERDDSTYEHDRRRLREATHRFGCHDTLRWDVLVAKADPLLWIPDAVAWSWARGGEWKGAVAPFCQVKAL